jgi:hypothetical protein
MNEKELVQEFVMAYDLVEQLEIQLSDTKKRKEDAQNRLIAHLDAVGATSTAAYENIGKVSIPKASTNASYDPEHEDMAMAYLRENGWEDAIRQTCHWKRFSSIVNQQMEAGKPLPEFIKLNTKRSVRLTR